MGYCKHIHFPYIDDLCPCSHASFGPGRCGPRKPRLSKLIPVDVAIAIPGTFGVVTVGQRNPALIGKWFITPISRVDQGVISIINREYKPTLVDDVPSGKRLQKTMGQITGEKVNGFSQRFRHSQRVDRWTSQDSWAFNIFQPSPSIGAEKIAEPSTVSSESNFYRNFDSNLWSSGILIKLFQENCLIH